ncbi:MAG TPA: hypothetical protein VGM89_19355 [Puia sp.]
MLQPLIRKHYPLVLACVCALSLTQCKKSHPNPAPPAPPPTPLVQPPKSMQVIRGNNLVGGINVHLYDTIVVRIIPNDPSDAEKYFFNTTANDSVGTMQLMGPELDSGGVNVTMFWQTGRQSPRQDVKFYLVNDVYYLVNYNPVPGIYSKNNNWGPINRGFDKTIGYYYLKNDGKFLLVADALYYKN